VNQQDGSATIETIIWIPILLLIIASVVDLGMYFNARTAVQAAAFEATRQASVADDPASTARKGVFDYAAGALPGWQENGRVDMTFNGSKHLAPGAQIGVNVTYRVPGIFSGLVPFMFKGSRDMEAAGSSQMTVEERP
jgi:Flp pilus assembly protein TadG